MGLVWPKLGNKAKYQSKSTTDIIGGEEGDYFVLVFLVSIINFLDFVDKLFSGGIKFFPDRIRMDAISAQQIMNNYTQTSCSIFSLLHIGDNNSLGKMCLMWASF